MAAAGEAPRGNCSAGRAFDGRTEESRAGGVGFGCGNRSGGERKGEREERSSTIICIKYVFYEVGGVHTFKTVNTGPGGVVGYILTLPYHSRLQHKIRNPKYKQLSLFLYRDAFFQLTLKSPPRRPQCSL